MEALIRNCQHVGLEETNRLAKMLERTDNKYVVCHDQLQCLSERISDQYYVLDIDGRTQFSYMSCYYDDHYECYFDHHQARRQRFKVRTREYLDSGLKFFEVKLKGRRGVTCKHRVVCDETIMPKINGEHFKMLNGVFVEQYKKPLHSELKPALLVGYQRCTLVARQGGERVTIDYALSFSKPRAETKPVVLSNNFIIVETKSKDGKGPTDLALKQLGIRKARKCSKYCLGLNLTGAVRKNNNFLQTIKHARKNIIRSNAGTLAVGA